MSEVSAKNYADGPCGVMRVKILKPIAGWPPVGSQTCTSTRIAIDLVMSGHVEPAEEHPGFLRALQMRREELKLNPECKTDNGNGSGAKPAKKRKKATQKRARTRTTRKKQCG